MEFLKLLCPRNYKDKWFYVLAVLAVLPLIYLILGEQYSYMDLNFVLLIVIAILSIFDVINHVRNKEKPKTIQSVGTILLIVFFAWILFSSFFTTNTAVTWIGAINGYRQSDDIWQFIFYFAIAICAINLKKENILYILNLFLFTAVFVMFMQFILANYALGFINRNHTSYYLCMTATIATMLFLYSKYIWQKIGYMAIIVVHYISMICNGSFGPIMGVVAFLILGTIYVAIYKRNLIKRMLGVVLAFILSASFIDFLVPRIYNDVRVEHYSIFSKFEGLAMFGLNKLGIVDNATFENADVDPGSGGYDRLKMWKRSIENMKERPLFGVGIGAWRIYNEDMPNQKPHNEFLQYGSSNGIPSLIIYLALLLYLFIKYRKDHKKISDLGFLSISAVFVYVVQSVFGNVLPFTAPLFFLLVGLAIREIDFVDEKNIKQNKN